MSAIGLLEQFVLNRAPKFLRGKNLGRLLKSYALTLDGSDEALRIGLTFNNPLLCPRDCLPAVAKDRGLKIPSSMPEEGVRQMLAQWFQLHRARGSHEGVLRHVRNYFAPGPYPTMQIVHQSGDGATAVWSKLDSAGKFTETFVTPSNFNYDEFPNHWARWWLFIYMHESGYTEPNTYDDGHAYDDGEVHDAAGANPFPVAAWDDIFTMAHDWKRGGTWLGGIALVWRAGDVNPASTPTQNAEGWWSLPSGFGTWRDATNLGTGLATRPPMVQWIYDNPS